ncbi:MAG: polymer-forming cytoskeletal protein [Planctomycetes bacterium]|nr:polymer-forming cytoskeletal protein [Planctomycetota bacterium]
MEQEFDTGSEVEVSVKTSNKGKKIAGGCGCGCLVIVLIIAAIIYWAYREATAFTRGFEEQGYRKISAQSIVVPKEDTVQGPVVYFGQSLVIEGTIDGNVAAMCQSVIIGGTINGKLDVLSQSVVINETGVVTGDVIAEAVQSLVNNGRVDGEISGTFQKVTSDEEVIQSD